MRRQRWRTTDANASDTDIAQFKSELAQMDYILVDSRGFRIQDFCLGGWVESSANAFEQVESEPEFRVLQYFAHGRLRDAQCFRGLGNRAGPHNGRKDLDLAQIQGRAHNLML